MSVSKIVAAAASGAGGGAGLDVDEVFSTYLYDGNSARQFIENGIRLGANRGSGASVQFDGDDDRVSFSGQLANAADSKTFTLSAFVYPQHTSDMMFFQYGETRFIFKVDNTGTLIVSGFNSSATRILNLESRLTSGGGLVTGGWQHVLVSVDLANTSNRHLYIDDAIPAHVDWDAYTNESIDFTTSNVGIAGSPTAVQGKQRLSNVYLDFTYRDLSTTSNRRLFIGTDLAPASGQASLNPIIYLPLDGTTANTGVNSGTGGNFTVTGSPTVLTDGGPFAHPDGGEGGLVWIKRRNGNLNHALFDTARGAGALLQPNLSAGHYTGGDDLTAFSSNGFTLGDGQFTSINYSSYNYASWTFRKAPKFFDVVTYTGTGSSLTINHSLGSEPAIIIIKRTNDSGNWIVFTDVADGSMDYLYLNTTDASADGSALLSKSSTSFTLLQSFLYGNSSGSEYVAYLFAHNDGDGEFGPDSDADVIKCGSFTEVNGSDVKVTLGFEPQWIIIKASNATGGWGMYDVMRGWTSGSDDFALTANTSDAESNVGDRWLIHPDGFTWKNTGNTRDIIYMAIRRGPLAVPEDATKVFSQNLATGFPRYATGFVTDFTIQSARDSGSKANYTRLTGTNAMRTTSSAAEFSSAWDWAQMTGSGPNFSSTNYIGWNWKRAPSYFDVCCYSGTGSARTVSHNLGVAPEMMWVKNRSVGTPWMVYHSALGNQAYLQLNDTAAQVTGNTSRWNATTPTASVFSVGDSGSVNGTSNNIISYLFATIAGVSKVGTYTGNGSGQNIDCGFSSGARFVLIKNASSSDNWPIFDSTRGIVAGNDAHLSLNATHAEASNTDYIDPYSSGFAVTGNDIMVNNSGDTYIFYAIA